MLAGVLQSRQQEEPAWDAGALLQVPAPENVKRQNLLQALKQQGGTPSAGARFTEGLEARAPNMRRQ
jgi:hypothetical protein